MSVEDFMRQFYPSMSDEEIAGYVALAAWRTELEAEVDGWLYSATCGNEGDSVWVLEKELDGSAPNE